MLVYLLGFRVCTGLVAVDWVLEACDWVRPGWLGSFQLILRNLPAINKDRIPPGHPGHTRAQSVYVVASPG